MNLNPNYEVIGKSFVQQYYAMLDNNDTRLQVANFYSVSGVPVTLAMPLLKQKKLTISLSNFQSVGKSVLDDL